MIIGVRSVVRICECRSMGWRKVVRPVAGMTHRSIWRHRPRIIRTISRSRRGCSLAVVVREARGPHAYGIITPREVSHWCRLATARGLARSRGSEHRSDCGNRYVRGKAEGGREAAVEAVRVCVLKEWLWKKTMRISEPEMTGTAQSSQAIFFPVPARRQMLPASELEQTAQGPESETPANFRCLTYTAKEQVTCLR